MTSYRRNRVQGGSYFFTVALADRSRSLLIDHVDNLRQAFRQVRQAHPFHIDGIVILPDHLHTIWTMPEGDGDYSLRWRQIKSAFSRTFDRAETVSYSRAHKQERGIWQRRFWEHTIRDEEDFARHLDYIHFNPVKHGHAKRVADWPYSSFHRYVRQGIYSLDWGGGNVVDLELGEAKE